ncbi:MAG: response regulator [Pseudomonadota bacterium]
MRNSSYIPAVSQPTSANFTCKPPELCEWATRKKHILIVEDNPLLQHFHSMWLNDLGYAVTVVDAGEDALRKNLANYDLVLMDLELPGDDGITITQKLLKNNPQLNLPVVACTSHAEADMKAACIAAGMVGYLQKPISPTLLERSLKAYLT